MCVFICVYQKSQDPAAKSFGQAEEPTLAEMKFKDVGILRAFETAIPAPLSAPPAHPKKQTLVS